MNRSFGGSAAGRDDLEITDDKLRELFALFDTDGGGTIDVPELTHALVSLGISETKEEIDRLVQQIDTDGSGEIDFEEFRTVMIQLLGQRDTVGEMYRAFQYFSGGKERISLADLRTVAMTVRDIRTESFLQELLILADGDRDGVVSFRDFREMMEAAIAAERSEGLNDPKRILDAATAAEGVQL